MARIPNDDALRRALRDAGLRITAPRVSVLRLLRRARLPLSHPEVVVRLADRGWDRATIYRNLTDLSRVGLARRTDLGDHVWRFEATGTGGRHRHPHFVCRRCGRVICLPHTTVEIHADADAPSAVRSGDLEIQIKGRCDRCREEEN